MATAPIDDHRHHRVLLLAAPPERHEENAVRREAMRRLDGQHLDIALVRHHELEPAWDFNICHQDYSWVADLS